jgi:CHASE3 domain sensor protein
MAVTHPPEEQRSNLLAIAAVLVALALGGLVLVTYWSGQQSSEAVESEEDAECRADWSQWVQEARDRVSEAQGTISQATFRGLRAATTDEVDAYRAAIALGDQADATITTWKPRIEVRRTQYQRVLDAQRDGTQYAREACKRGPPR